jgi:hypothetical protein
LVNWKGFVCVFGECVVAVVVVVLFFPSSYFSPSSGVPTTTNKRREKKKEGTQLLGDQVDRQDEQAAHAEGHVECDRQEEGEDLGQDVRDSVGDGFAQVVKDC